jgi:hypothetical protein
MARKAKPKRLNRRQAIRNRCIDCSGWSSREVTNCTFNDCDLYPYRMGRGRQDPKARDQAIRRYCLWCMVGQRNEVRLCPSVNCSLHPYRMTTTGKSNSRAESAYQGATSETVSLGSMS